MSEAVQLVADCVEQCQAIKATEVVCHDMLKEVCLSDLDICQVLEEAVIQKKVVEVEYVLPNQPYRTKSIYFPLGTTLIVPKEE